MLRTLVLALLVASPAALADHNDGYPRCVTESNGRWYTLKDTARPDVRFMEQDVIAMCSNHRGSDPAQCAIHADCGVGEQPRQAVICSAHTASRPEIRHIEWSTPEKIGTAVQIVIARCKATALSLRDHKLCENSARNCVPVTRANLDAPASYAAPVPPAPVPPIPAPVVYSQCTTSAFGQPFTSDAFIDNGNVVTRNQYENQALLRCTDFFSRDPRSVAAQNQCRRNR
jgi:hypothetical protein